MSRIEPLALALLLLTPAASPQSLQVDFEPVNSPPGTAPSTYGGPAGAPGFWNSVSTLSTTNLVAADGSPTAVDLVIGSPSGLTQFGFDDQASGADEPLLDDFVRADLNQWTIDLSGLAPGEYRVYTVLVQDNNIFAVSASVTGSPDPQQYCGGEWIGTYVQGSSPGAINDGPGNFTLHAKTVTDGSLQIRVFAEGFVDQAHVRGIQLVRVDEHAEPQCFGDGSGPVACPCANSGAASRGCQNSVVAQGARLYSSGTDVPDTLVLHAEGVLPSAFSVFVQGNATITPVVFGDGLRCAGGDLKRLYVKNASGGFVHAPSTGDPSITQQSANLGDLIPPGDRRYYQVFYRDPDPSFCVRPSGGSFNATNALKVVW